MQLRVECATLSATLCNRSGQWPEFIEGALVLRRSIWVANREMDLQQARKKQFKLDLAELHAVCEANYERLLRLFPDYALLCHHREEWLSLALLRRTGSGKANHVQIQFTI